MVSKRSFFILLIMALFLPALCYAQVGETKDVTDSQGNKYKVDSRGDIYTDGIPHPERQPASVENISYYFNQSLMLDTKGYTKEAFQMYREILLLPDGDESVGVAKWGVRTRVGKLYEKNKFRDLLLEYFDIAKIGEDKYEVTPRP